MLIYASLSWITNWGNSVIFSARTPFCSRFLKGNLLTDPETYTSWVMDCFFYCTHFYCSFSGDLFTVSNEWILILISLTVSIVCYHFATAVLECMGNVFHLLLIIQTSRVHKMEVFVCGNLVMLRKSHHIAHLDRIKEWLGRGLALMETRYFYSNSRECRYFNGVVPYGCTHLLQQTNNRADLSVES